MSVYFIYALSFFNGIGVSSAQMVLPLYALDLGASPFAVGMLAATYSICPTLLAVTSGKLIDRVGARWPMLAGATCGGLGLLAPYLFRGMPAVYFAGTMNGLCVVLFSLATQNLVGVLSTPQSRARDFSNYMLTNSSAQFLAPLLGGFAIDHAGHAMTCLYLALLSLVPIALLAARGGALAGGTSSAAKTRGGGIRMLLSDPVVRRTLVSGSLLSAGLNLYQIYLPVYGHSIGLAASAIGIVMAMNSSAAFVSRFGLPWLIGRFGEERLLAHAFFVGAVTLALVPIFNSAVLLALVSFVFGLGMGCGQPIVIMLMYANSKDGRSAEALGLKITTNQLTKLVSPVLFGAVASALNLFTMFWINAAMMAAAGAITRPGPVPAAESEQRPAGDD